MNILDFDNFRLTSNFSRLACKGGGKCRFVMNHLQAKEVNYLVDMSCDKVFELSAVEILDHNIITLCIYTGHPMENFMISYLN